MAAMGGAEGMGGMGGMPGMGGMGGMGAGRSPEDHKKEVEALKAVSAPPLARHWHGTLPLLHFSVQEILVLCLERHGKAWYSSSDQVAMACESRVRPTPPPRTYHSTQPPLCLAGACICRREVDVV